MNHTMVDTKDKMQDIGGNKDSNDDTNGSIPGDMSELYCDVEEETPSTSLPQPKGIPDNEELYCDVDEETPSTSLNTGSLEKATEKSTTKNPSTMAKYPSKEANSDDSIPKKGTKILMQNEDRDAAKMTNPISYDTLTHRMKSKMNGRQRNRRDYDSDDESEHSESNSDSHQIYPSIGAVAVNSSGAVPQRPGVLSSLPMGNFDESTYDGMQTTIDGGDTWIDATVETAPTVGDVEKKKTDCDVIPEDEKETEKPVDLPWYWSRFFWIMVAVLVVALGAIVTVVLVLVGGEEDPTPPPTPSPIDPIKAGAFERYVGTLDSNAMPQMEAYYWLVFEDEITNFSENMSQADIDIMKTRYNLAVFYFTLGGENWWSPINWLGGNVSHCDWRGVGCDMDGDINNLTLDDNNLQGTLPSEVVQLSTLETLILSDNRIESVKAFENGLDSLKRLEVGSNPLKDHEAIFALTNLELLGLYDTEFSGTLPIEIRKLSNMKDLILSMNKLQGPLVNRFQTMSNLEQFWSNSNHFDATLEDILDCGGCSNTLRFLVSDGNPLTGSIPDRLFDFNQLYLLWISKSGLTGTIPTEIGKLTGLGYLYLYENFYFSDTNVLPTELGNLSELRRLDFSDSVVGGTVPTELANLSNLNSLKIGRTMQTGSIPEGICAITTLDPRGIEHGSEVDCTCPGNVCSLIPSR